MTGSPHIDITKWPQAQAAGKVLAALTAAGGEGRFVGGCVRDALVGRAVGDIDIATNLKPDAVIAALKEAGLRSVPTGLQHGTITAIADHVGFEVTTLRHDVATDGRHATVVFTNDWILDAARRDLTMNALFCDASGKVFDYFDGLADLQAGHVRFVGDPAQRMDEDYLRILRFFRFHAGYAAGDFDPAALAAATARRHELKRLSGERLRQETLKLLLAKNGVAVWGEMLRLGFAESYLPQATSLDRLAKMARLEAGLDIAPDAIRRLSALAITGSGPAIGEILKLSNAERARLDLMSGARPDFGVADPHLVRRQIYDLGNAGALDLLLMDWGLSGSESDHGRALEIIRTWRKPAFPVAGRDLLKFGFEAGPEMGAKLAELEAWWITGDFTADRDAGLAKAREMIS